jgi:hypothetical protein
VTQEPAEAIPSNPIHASPRGPRGSRTICLPIAEQEYQQTVEDPIAFRAWLDHHYRQSPELFPLRFEQGYVLKDSRSSCKLPLRLRRIELREHGSFSIRPSFVMPYLCARTEDVEGGLWLRKFGVPFWALPRICGRDPMFWYRLECGLGRSSIVGTTVRRRPLPQDLLADEHHQKRDGLKTYLATTVAKGCLLGVEPTDDADGAGLEAAYGVFRQEAREVQPDYSPKTVNTDGWSGTQAAWKALFPKTVLILCFLHAWLSIRDRAKHLGATFVDLSRRVWDAYHAPTRRSFAQPLRSLRQFAHQNLTGIVLKKTLSLGNKRERLGQAYKKPGCYRTSNMLDRLMRAMNRYFFDGQHLHGSIGASRLHGRAWALLWNFTPWSPASTRANGGWRCPAERFNQHRYHEHWLQNLLISASLGGYRGHRLKPQIP